MGLREKGTMVRKFKIYIAFIAVIFAALVVVSIRVSVSLSAESDPDHFHYRKLLDELGLDDNPAHPSKLLSDEKFRTKLQEKWVSDSKGLACESIRTVSTISRPDDGTEVALVEYRVAKLNLRLHGLLTVPIGAGPYGVVLYANSGYFASYDNQEHQKIFSNVKSRVVVAAPLFAGELFTFEGRTYVAEGGKQAYVNEVDRMQGLANCLHTKSQDVKLASGEPLQPRLLKGRAEAPGVKMIAAGSGRGGLIASLLVARSGAGLLASQVSEPFWPRVDCGVLVNPMHTLLNAEARLKLASLVRGNSEETKYVRIPGFTELRYDVLKKYRSGELSAAEAAFELARRDAYFAAPFVNIGLKNYSFPPNEKGLRAGGLLVLHGDKRTDFTANESRIFANIHTTVQFATTAQTNGMNLLYREFRENDIDASQSYENIFSTRMLRNGGRSIDNLYVAFTDSVVGKEKWYRWMIRGRAYTEVERTSVADTTEEFLIQGCGLH